MKKISCAIIVALGVGPLACTYKSKMVSQGGPYAIRAHRARNVILFVGDGMGVSTVTAARIFAVGTAGQLAIDTMPYTAISRTYNADHITPDSAGTITAMMTGVNANMGILGFGPETERQDFNKDGDGTRLWTLPELAKQARMKVGVVTTARVTHATPAGCFAHVNERNHESTIALQALPSDAQFNDRLVGGLDIWMGGGRQYFVPCGQLDEEGDAGVRADGRDLREEFQRSGYTYVWNTEGFDGLSVADLPVLGLFENSHMEYEFDRASDIGGEPSLTEMTTKTIEWLEESNRSEPANRSRGYFLLVEGGRIDHAHHLGNAFRALHDTQEFDHALAAAIDMVNLNETLIVVTADHSHVFTIAGYPLIEAAALPYRPKSAPEAYMLSPHHNILDIVYDIDASTGEISETKDRNGVPYTVLGYANGPGRREAIRRRDPRSKADEDEDYVGPNDPSYLQEATVPDDWETHGGEDVVIYAIGAGAEMVHGTVKNTFVFDVMAEALGLRVP